MKSRLLLAILVSMLAATLVVMPRGTESAFATEESTAEWIPLEDAVGPHQQPDDAIAAQQFEGHLGRRSLGWPGRQCTFYARADNVHMSTTVKGDISAHGAWVDTSNGHCPSLANVTVELRALARYRSSGRTEWVTVSEVSDSRRSA